MIAENNKGGKLEHLLQALNSPEEEKRLYAVQDLMEYDRDIAKPLLERLTVETSQLVRDAIVFTLKKINIQDSFFRIFNLFLHSDAYLRNAAVDIFGAQKEEAIAYLTSQLDHSDREVRKLILDALYIIGSPEAVMAIRAGLYDPAVNVRITAVGYLGQLADRESTAEMISLLAREKEPMLKAAILESLPVMADENDIQSALAIIIPGGDISCLDPVFLPQVIRMTGRTGDLKFLCRVLENVEDIGTYGDDILQAIGRIKSRIPDLFHHQQILEKIYRIIEEPAVAERVRYSAIELLLSNGIRELEQLDRLGGKLISEPKMVQGGVRLLHASGSEEGRTVIINLMKATDDKHLLAFCEELFGDNAVNGG